MFQRCSGRVDVAYYLDESLTSGRYRGGHILSAVRDAGFHTPVVATYLREASTVGTNQRLQHARMSRSCAVQ